MSKGLEALEKLKQLLYYEMDEINFINEVEAIEKELNRLTQYDIHYEQNMKWLEQAKKKLKAFEIIKEIWGDRILNDIEQGFILGSPYTNIPNKEKCDLLKEVLL